MSTHHNQPGPSPYLIGVAIGLLNICAFAAFRKGIGVSGAYENSAALAARRLAPDAAHVNSYVKARKEPPKFNWESWLVLGTIFGGMAAARTFGKATSGDVGRSAGRPKRSPLASAAGGAMLMFGARMADGCTSGHALSGTAQGAGSSWLFTPVMFGVGSLLARMTRELFPYNYVAPGQTVNLLVNFTALVESHAEYRAIAKDLQVELGQEDQSVRSLNEFSGPSYRVVSFVADVPVRVPDTLLPPAKERDGLGRVIFTLLSTAPGTRTGVRLSVASLASPLAPTRRATAGRRPRCGTTRHCPASRQLSKR